MYSSRLVTVIDTCSQSANRYSSVCSTLRYNIACDLVSYRVALFAITTYAHLFIFQRILTAYETNMDARTIFGARVAFKQIKEKSPRSFIKQFFFLHAHYDFYTMHLKTFFYMAYRLRSQISAKLLGFN